ncbi:MAG: lytic transglycosylase domain-containing protein [Candidatus Zixiibacteriota bacterium]|nr:lytic transglycosylase domain-containing protein [candidate division Zixibacteria bacterium]MBU1471108.1 lytic transglycosylase domain-containing protein [candidate division Zixibacteria bacterium]
MPMREKMVRITGLAMSRPVAFVFALIYVFQSATIFYLLTEKYENEKLIQYQQSKIEQLEEKLKILDIIEDFQIGMRPSEIGTLANVVYNESRKYGYDPLLLLALIQVESSFKKEQVSNMGAIGLMQVKPSIGSDVANRRGIDWHNRSMLLEPDYNVELGSLYLFELVLKFGDLKEAITAYNIGPTRLSRLQHDDITPPNAYLAKVLKKYRSLKAEYDS